MEDQEECSKIEGKCPMLRDGQATEWYLREKKFYWMKMVDRLNRIR